MSDVTAHFQFLIFFITTTALILNKLLKELLRINSIVVLKLQLEKKSDGLFICMRLTSDYLLSAGILASYSHTYPSGREEMGTDLF